MGDSFYINKDGTVTPKNSKKTVRDIEWIDFKRINRCNYSVVEIFCILIYMIPVYGWLALLIDIVANKIYLGEWVWPFQPIVAIQDTSDSVKIYCTKNGKLGLYSKKRLTPAIFDSIEQLPTADYPAYILGYDDKFCLYNHVQRKVMFKKSTDIIYIGNHVILVKKDDKGTKYSLIGMRLK